MEEETVQGSAGEDIELMSINSLQFNRKHSILNAKLKTSAGQNNIIVPYKIDTGSDSKIIPEHVFKNCFQR